MRITRRERMDMATALKKATEARKQLDDALEFYEAVRESRGSAAASAPLMTALIKARKLGWAVEDLERAAGEVSRG